MAKWTGQRVREVSTSLISSLSLARTHWGRCGPAKAARKVRGEPEGVRFKTGAREEETDDEGEGGSNHFAVNGLGGVRVAGDRGGGHPLKRQREREKAKRNQRGKRSEARVRWVRV